MILLDTHALIWWVEDAGRLSETAEAAITESSHVLVSSICFWEFATLMARGRITVDRDPVRWTRDLVISRIVELAELTPYVAIAGARLPEFHGDPADRLIYATAREMEISLVSKDSKMREYARRHGDVQVIW